MLTHLAVIPTLSILGPLAFLAVLFPAVFGGLMLWLKRWSNYLGALSTVSTVYWLMRYGQWFAGNWWGSEAGLWAILSLGIAPFALASVWRYRRNVEAMQPRPSDRRTLFLLSVAFAALLAWRAQRGSDLSRTPWLEVGVMAVSVVAAWLYLATSRRTTPAALAGESVALWTLLAASVAALALNAGRASTSSTHLAEGRSPIVAWSHTLPEAGRLDGTPTVHLGRFFIGASHAKGFNACGAVYAFDRGTGQQVWKFDDDGGLKPVFCVPAYADGKLYVGEGYHEDKACHLFCLDAETGQKLWAFETTSHTESGPAVADGRVYFGAGDDGVYCLDAATGKEIWHHEGVHVNASPVLVGGRLFASSGTGPGNKFNVTELFCLDAATGKPVWRTPVNLSAFAACAVADGKLYVGLGNGDFVKSHPRPAGALLCVDAATGQRLWRCDVPDAVLTRPAFGDGLVYFGCRDGQLYAASLAEGRVRWKADLGGPVVASPTSVPGVGVYAAGSHGRLACLDGATGRELWAFDALKAAGTAEVQLWATPVVTAREGRRTIVLAGTATNLVTSQGRLWRIED